MILLMIGIFLVAAIIYRLLSSNKLIVGILKSNFELETVETHRAKRGFKTGAVG